MLPDVYLALSLPCSTLVVAGNQILERDPATHRTLAAHSLQDVWSIVRYADDLARFALEYTNDDDAHPHHYRTAQRDLFLANLLDAYVCTRAHAVPPLERLKSILPASGVSLRWLLPAHACCVANLLRAVLRLPHAEYEEFSRSLFDAHGMRMVGDRLAEHRQSTRRRQ